MLQPHPWWPAAAHCASEARRQKSVDNCVTAAAREFKVPASAVAVAGSSSPRDLLYSVDLRVGPQGRSAVCTVNENGEVMGVVFKRPT